ncbi:MAG: type IV secretion system DNA-binding domain-containing protein [bacterium]
MQTISDLDQNDFYTNPDVNFFACTNFRNQFRKFGIKTDDRRRHMYVVGKTGMGKTTLLENMVLNDIYAGHGVGLVDPHGDFAEKIINYIPPRRINDVIYFNPADVDHPVGFNILEILNPEHKHLVAAGLMDIFKKIWVDMWSSRMEYILNNTILALLDYPGTTLLGINRMLSDSEYRRRIVRNIKDPVVKSFWVTEFASYQDRYAQEAVAPIQNKIGQFLSASVIRNIVAQVKSKINVRSIMDEKKIFIMNLSKGRIGEDNSRLLGGMLVTKLQLSAMERVDTPEEQRPDFFLYVDEFQNFATPSFANILSEARKYHLSLIMAHQYMEQLDETVLASVIGNIGSILTFRVGSTDAELLAKEFIPTFEEPDLINLSKYNIYLKLMIDGVASRPFSANTLPPIATLTNSAEKVIKVSRERYAADRSSIEDKIARWSGMEIEGYDDEEEDLFIREKEKNKIVARNVKKDSPGNSRNIGNNRLKQQKYSGSTPRAGGKYKPAGFQKVGQENKKLPHISFDKARKVSIVDTSQKGISLESLANTALPRNSKYSGNAQYNNGGPVTDDEMTKFKNSINSNDDGNLSAIRTKSKFNVGTQQLPNVSSLSNNSLSSAQEDNIKRTLRSGRVAKFE